MQIYVLSSWDSVLHTLAFTASPAPNYCTAVDINGNVIDKVQTDALISACRKNFYCRKVYF